MTEPMTDEYIDHILAIVHNNCKEKLIKHRAKGKPEPLNPFYCLTRLDDEELELLKEIIAGDKTKALLEAADVALFAFYAAINITEN